jgi:rSAM/selenodomain-associated transferase 2
LAANQGNGESIRDDLVLKISVIIPALNEASNLPQTLASVRASHDTEVIVVDGGSQDATIEVAKAFQAKVIAAPPGRAMQMNWGAQAAAGDILLFLHADTRLPPQWDERVQQTLNQPGVVAGAFHLAIEGEEPGLRWVEWGVGVRSRLFQMPYGDQAIFLTAKVFHGLGGFPDLPIMEDFELVRQLRRRGKVAVVPAAVLTSGRRWQQLGILRTTLINQVMVFGYLLGVSLQRLVYYYRNWSK